MNAHAGQLIALPPRTYVFHGEPRVYWLATCTECNEGRRPHPMPFATDADRGRWVAGHATTGHTIALALEIRE